MNPLLSKFPFTPTDEQGRLFDSLYSFLFQAKEPHSAYLLTGFAGTGKTTVLSTVIKFLEEAGLKSVLLAPTGRSAKVLSLSAALPAQTIHRKIYWQRNSLAGISYTLSSNKHTNTIFIVDECSMISGPKLDESSGSCLLDDLISYIYQGKNCRAIFLGDLAQLPPVGSSNSPALDEELLYSRYSLEISSFSLNQVMRQSADSSILHQATSLRSQLETDELFPTLKAARKGEVARIEMTDFTEALSSAYASFGLDNTLVICRSNKEVSQLNGHIRNAVLGRDNELEAGDSVMTVKNNYHWLPHGSEMGFIANGDVARVTKLSNVHDRYGLRFADAVLWFTDYLDQPLLHCKLLISTLSAASPALDPIASKALYGNVLAEYGHLKTKQERLEQLKVDPYLNALQIKFSYAVTCHKAQGGQWDAIFIHQGYLTKEMMGDQYLRWLYTACTRAVKRLYFVGFNERFFGSRGE